MQRARAPLATRDGVGMRMRRVHRVGTHRFAVVGAVVVAWLAVTAGSAEAAGGVNLLKNGTFEGSGSGSTSGWSASNATLSLASDGAGGGFAGRVAATAAGTYKITASPKPAKLAPLGEQFRATGMVRSDAPGKSVCLQVVESGAVSRTTQQCVTAAATWTAFPTVAATVAADGDTLSLVVRQGSGVVGDSFEADSLSIVDTDTAAPTVPGNLRATAASSAEVDLAWDASTDAGHPSVAGYAVYRNGSTKALATVSGSTTSFADTSVVSGTTYSYTVAAFDYAQNFSAPSAPASAKTPIPNFTPTFDTWHMDETGGTTMADATGHHPGTTKNVTLDRTGDPRFPGTAYGFNGTSALAYVPNAPDLNPMSADVQIGFSLRTTSVPAVPDYDLVRKGVSPDQEFKTELQTNGQASCYFKGNLSSITVQAGPDLHDGAWHRILCSKTATTVSLTIDGTTWSKAKQVGSISNTSPLLIGAHGTSGGDLFAGDLDEVTYRTG